MKKKTFTFKEKPIIAKYYVAPYSGKKWRRIMVNGKKTEYEMNKEGEVRDRKTGLPINPSKTGLGYMYYKLALPDGNCANIARHRLMMALFVPIPRKYRELGYSQEHLTINHIDGVKGHDTLENLEWCTVKENMQHAIDTGLVKYLGENSHLATITDDDVIEICELLQEGKRPKEVSELTGIKEKIVRHIYNKESWNHISKDYVFPETQGPVPYTYSDELVEEICRLIQEGKLNNREIAEKVGEVSDKYVNDVKNKKRRTDISNKYNFSNVSKKKRLEKECA